MMTLLKSGFLNLKIVKIFQKAITGNLAKRQRPPYNVPSRADIAQLVEHRLPKPRVAGSNPVVRSIIRSFRLPS